jgi:hypothetical protein
MRATRSRQGRQKRRHTAARITIDHDEIRDWAEERGAWPAHVVGTGRRGDIGLLRLDFPGYSGEGRLEEISWDEFFEKFDDANLAFLYQEETSSGERSNFNKLVRYQEHQDDES